MSTYLNHVEQTQEIIFSADETTDFGYETGTSVTFDYTVEMSKFTQSSLPVNLLISTV